MSPRMNASAHQIVGRDVGAASMDASILVAGLTTMQTSTTEGMMGAMATLI